MARAKNPDAFAPQIRDFIEKLANAPEPKQEQMKFASREAAEKIRFTIYSYLKACDNQTDDAALKERIKVFRRVYMMKVRGEILIFALRFDEPNMDVLTEKMLEMDLEAQK